MMKKMLLSMGLSVAALAVGLNAEEISLNGGGASFPAPVYQAWTYSYNQGDHGSKVNYLSIGSGAGVNQIKAKTLDFAGTDNPLTLEEQEKDNLIQFPMLTGGVVVIVNIPGIANNQLKLSKEVLAEIFLNKINRWDDEKIKALNPNLKLPKMKISVVRRADASGTTFIFTNYLAKISNTWAEQVGFGSSVKWPVGLGGQKNPGVCNNVAKIRGSIGYTEYTYAVEAKLAMATLENADGKFVEPNVQTFSAAAANANWQDAPGFYMILTNQAGETSWPITGVTYCLIRKDAPEAQKAALIEYFKWCFTTGENTAKKLNYVPIPANVVKLIYTKF